MRRTFTTFLLGLALLLVPGIVAAQDTGVIVGTVTDAANGEPLPGANVVIQGTNQGAATNPQGEFRIEDVAPGEYTLVGTFIGYRSTEEGVEVSAGEETVAAIELRPDFTGLEEVVVTGIATSTTRANASVAVSRVQASELTEVSNYGSLDQLVGGNVTGVNVQQSSGNVGSGIRFRIRGGVSLNGDGQPVIYVDGVRIDQNEVEGFGAGGQGVSPLADIDPENIASIEILKGSASTAIYGTDGAEGVVLITTKNGLPGQDFRITYRGTLGSTSNVAEYDEDRYISADEANDLFRTGSINQHRVSATGSFDKVNYFASVSNRIEEGILENNRGERTNFAANFEVTPTEQVTLRANSQYSLNELQRPDNDNNIFGQLGNTLLAPGGATYAFTDSTSVFLIDDQQRVERFIGSLQGSYNPSFLPNLELSATAGLDVSYRRQDRTFPFEGTYTGITNGERNIYNRSERQWNSDVSARYFYQITPDLVATSVVGGQFFATSRRVNFTTAQDFSTGLITDIGAGSEFLDIDEEFLNERQGGLFAQQEFTYKDTYRLEATLRRDFATALGEEVGASSILYPGVRGSVRFDRFDFVPESFDLLKLRAAFGQSGTLPDLDDVEALRFQAEPSGFGAGATLSTVGDPALEPERVSELELGVDLDYQGRISFQGTYFYQRASNSIIPFAPAPSTGFGGFEVPRNVGEVVGQGVELGLGLTPLRTESAQIDLDLNYTYQRSEVTDLGGQEIPGGFDLNFLVEGIEPYSFYTREVLGAQFDEDGVYAGPELSTERQFVGAPRPDHFGGVRLNVRLIDNLTITSLAEFALGQQVFNNTRLFGTLFGNNPEFSRLQAQVLGGSDDIEQLEPGTPEYIEAANAFARLNPSFDANFVEDADYLKLREISVRYDFTDLIRQAGLTSGAVREFSIGLSGRNLLTWTEYGGPDPEVNFDGSRGQIQGQDFLTLQTPRTYTATLTVGF